MTLLAPFITMHSLVTAINKFMYNYLIIIIIMISRNPPMYYEYWELVLDGVQGKQFTIVERTKRCS